MNFSDVGTAHSSRMVSLRWLSSCIICPMLQNKYCVSEFNERRLYTGLQLDYRLRATFASRPISAVAELLVISRQVLLVTALV